MLEKHFEDFEQYHLTAAQIGIYRKRWTAVKEQDSVAEAQKLMQAYQYDVLPIEQTGEVTHYYHTEHRGDFSSITKKTIEPHDKIYYLTELEDLIHLFKERNQSFFFLWDHHHIHGLVSEVNLRSTAVSTFLYARTNAIEKAMAQLLKMLYSEADLKKLLWDYVDKAEKPDEKTKKHELTLSVVKAYEKSKKQNNHLHFIEQLNFSHVLDIIRKEDLLKEIGHSKNSLKKLFNKIKTIRDHISHPVRESISAKEISDFLNSSSKLISDLKKAELFVHYRQTNYKLHQHPEYPLRIGKPLPEVLREYCPSDKSWCFITASNPGSQPLHQDINELLNGHLENEIKQLNCRVFKGQGESTTTPNYAPEQSFWIPDISREQALALGRRFGQNAIVYGKGSDNAELIILS